MNFEYFISSPIYVALGLFCSDEFLDDGHRLPPNYSTVERNKLLLTTDTFAKVDSIPRMDTSFILVVLCATIAKDSK